MYGSLTFDFFKKGASTYLSGMLVTMSTGIMRSIYLDYDKRCDLVPADAVVNLLIAAAFNVGGAKSIGHLNR